MRALRAASSQRSRVPPLRGLAIGIVAGSKRGLAGGLGSRGGPPTEVRWLAPVGGGHGASDGSARAIDGGRILDNGAPRRPGRAGAGPQTGGGSGGCIWGAYPTGGGGRACPACPRDA